MKRLICNCGAISHQHHIDDPLCYRETVPRDEVPIKLKNKHYGEDREFEESLHEEYMIGTQLVSEFTLKQTRLYSQHEDGRWSRPKKVTSEISIGEEW